MRLENVASPAVGEPNSLTYFTYDRRSAGVVALGVDFCDLSVRVPKYHLGRIEAKTSTNHRRCRMTQPVWSPMVLAMPRSRCIGFEAGWDQKRLLAGASNRPVVGRYVVTLARRPLGSALAAIEL